MASQEKNTFNSRKNIKSISPRPRSRTSKASEKAFVTKSKTAARKTRSKKMSAKEYGILMVLIMGLAVLLGITVYFPNQGNLLGQLRYFVFGFSGVITYILPPFILIVALFKVANQGNQRLDDKIRIVSLALVDLAIMTHIFYVGQAQIHLKLKDDYLFFPSLANYFRVSAGHQVAGGFIGGLFGDMVLIVLGKWGGLVLCWVLLMVLLLVFTELSLAQVLGFVQTLLQGLFAWIKEKIKQVEEEKAKEERAREEKEAKVGWEEAIIESELSGQNLQAGGREQPATTGQTRKQKKAFSFLNIDLSPKPEEEASLLGEGEKEDEASSPEQGLDQADPALVAAGSGFEQKAEVGAQPEKGIDKGADQDRSKVEGKIASKTPGEEAAKPVQVEMNINQDLRAYAFPPVDLLKQAGIGDGSDSQARIEANAQKLEETLKSFGVNAKVINVSQGPTVTRYEIQPAQGVKVSKIVGLADDIALNLAAAGIRMEAPIPGKSAIGIEVPNREAGSVMLREVIDSSEFSQSVSKLSFGLGKDITGRVLVADIGKMPHLLIAGATGSGKSVCINTLITSLLYKAKPEEVRLLMIDPKVVELSVYNGIPHLLIPVVTDPKKAAGALNWAVQEMNDRYKLFAASGVRDLKGYNKMIEERGDTPKLPQIVIIVDELADLMMVASNEVEDTICRLAQMARAAGLHLIIATQRPSVDVITGLIKANIPSRIAFNVSSGTDSRTIIDMNGAEKLLGKGDMLFYPVGYPKPVRIQGAFISDHEVEKIVDYLKTQQQSQYNQKIMNHLNKADQAASGENQDDLDDLFAEALELVVDKERASASMIQRQFRVGFNRAARIIDQLSEAGYVGQEQGSKPREVLLTRRELDRLKAGPNQTPPRGDQPGPVDTGQGQVETKPDQISRDTGLGESKIDDDLVNDAINDMMEEVNQTDQD